MKVIGLGLQKGGTGKTTISVCLAAELAKAGKTLLVDCDPQGNASSVLLDKIGYELADVLSGEKSIAEAGEQTKIDNLYILPTSPLSDKLNNYRQSNEVNTRPYRIDDMLREVGSYFDYVVLDTSPAFGIFEQNVFYACNELITVVSPDTFGADGLYVFQKHIVEFVRDRRKNDLKRDVLVVNKYNASLKTDKAIKQLFVENPTYKCVVMPQDQDIKVSQLERRLPAYKTASKEAISQLVELVR